MANRASPPILALRAFEAAARNMSFTLAAAELHLTQGAISRQVRILEEFLGKKLFDRFTRRVELTGLGRDYFVDIQRALLDIERATQRIISTSSRAVLTVSVVPTLGSAWLMPRLARFVEDSPQTDVRLITSIDPVNFQGADVDVAVRVGRLPGESYPKDHPRIELEMVTSWKGVHAEYLLPDSLVPVMSKTLLASGPPIRSPRDLLAYPLLHTASRKNAWRDWLGAHDVELVEEPHAFDFGHFFMGLRAAERGKGIAIVPSIVLHDLPSEGALVCPLPPDVRSAGNYYFLCRESKLKDRSIQRFREWLFEEAALIRP